MRVQALASEFTENVMESAEDDTQNANDSANWNVSDHSWGDDGGEWGESNETSGISEVSEPHETNGGMDSLEDLLKLRDMSIAAPPQSTKPTKNKSSNKNDVHTAQHNPNPPGMGWCIAS